MLQMGRMVVYPQSSPGNWSEGREEKKQTKKKLITEIVRINYHAPPQQRLQSFSTEHFHLRSSVVIQIVQFMDSSLFFLFTRLFFSASNSLYLSHFDVFFSTRFSHVSNDQWKSMRKLQSISLASICTIKRLDYGVSEPWLIERKCGLEKLP